ncbi:hypothetical protein HYFRA_00008819 [Hymenoscyphus fraxineus]|uniref:Uncharacterized protein n=1 Tax=Hymenoscyphus fraxineus TaxID=746836 RepID=A0A9N9L1G5_9HELO|nr:hypothetical protein HYFRA_00008819 [Hymenoscyphus fraxineus]
MPFLNLDIDVLILIIQYLGPTERESRNNNLNLAYTCKALYKLAQPYAAETFNESIPSKRYKLLRRTLRYNPEYGKDVKVFSFDVKDPAREYEIVDCIQSLPNLRELRCESPLESIRLAPIVLTRSLPLRDNLQSLTLHKTQISTSKLFEILALPRLKYLDVEHESKTSMFEPDDFKTVGHSELRTLIIGKLHVDVFLRLIRFTNSLTVLSCCLPIPGPLKPIQSNIPRRRAEPIRIPYFLSPRDFMSAFRCLSRTLTTLNLNSGGIWGNFDVPFP